MNSCGKYRLPSRSAAFHSSSTALLDPAHRLLLGDARVRDAVQVPPEQRLLLGGAQLAVVRDAHVVVVRDEVEDVLLEVRARAGDGVDLVLPDHLGERQPELGGGHRAGHRQEHLAAAREKRRSRPRPRPRGSRR